MYKLMCMVILVIVVSTLFFSCDRPKSTPPIILATTTSTQDSGLLDYLLPLFKAETGLQVNVIAVGTGQALNMGERATADVLLIHDTPSEEKFVREGHAPSRSDIMYNDFVLVASCEDAARIRRESNGDIEAALRLIREEELSFISRGDNSGTHKKEQQLWQSVSIAPQWDNYTSVGKGMGETLTMTYELGGFTLSDRATYLSMKAKLPLEIVVEGDDSLKNQYGILLVNRANSPDRTFVTAQRFIDWMLSEKTQSLIGQFGIDQYGQPLFIPNAKKRG